jgi:hypothetical protein
MHSDSGLYSMAPNVSVTIYEKIHEKSWRQFLSTLGMEKMF